MATFGVVSALNPHGRPANPLFGGTTNNTQTNSLTSAPALGTPSSQNQQMGGGLFGQQNQQNQQQQQPAVTNSLFGSASTPSQSTTGLFGNQQQPATSGSLLGNALTSQSTAGNNLFGNAATQQQQQPATGGGLFGSTPQQQQPAAGGSLFGSTPQQQQPATGGGLFGSTPQQQQPAAGGGLFGSTPQQQQPAAGGGLFGSTPQQQQPAAGGGLFGSTPQQQQPVQQTGQQPAGNSLFGNTATAPNQTASLFGNAGSLFGNSGTTTLPQTGASSLLGNTGTGASSIFGNTSQQSQLLPQSAQTNNAFGTSSLFGSKPAAAAPQVTHQVQPGQTLFTRSTKFNDLPDNLKQLLENIDAYTRSCMQTSKDLYQRKLGEGLVERQEMIEQMQKELNNTSYVIRNDLRHTEDLKDKVDRAMQDLVVASRIFDAFRNPQSGTTYLKDHASFPFEFFQRVTQQVTERMAWVKTTIEKVERKLSTSAGQVQTPQSIATTLQAQNTTFLALASQTAALETELHKIKTAYTQLWRANMSSARDPFDEVDDLGFGSLRVK
ncbi:Nucleoporin nup49/NSP49 (Nuclear pore protein nup49/NSP49) [Leucoagaricus gongylophorus]